MRIRRAGLIVQFVVELTWLRPTRRSDAAMLAEAELKLVNQISELKRRHTHLRNSRQPLCRISPEMLTKSLSFLSAKDELSIIRVCQHLREHVINTPGLWTHVDRIQNPCALSFVLGRARKVPVDITNLAVEHQNDVRFEAIAAHMQHIRSLCLHFSQDITTLYMPSRAYTAFTTTAPLLQRLSLRPQRDFRTNGRSQVHSVFNIPGNTMPRLSSLQLHGVELSITLCGFIQSLRAFSFSFRDRSQYGESSLEQSACQYLHNLCTVNIELAGWNTTQRYPYFGSSVKHINIRWTKPGLFVPRDAVPNQAPWGSIQTVHVSHVYSIPAKAAAATLPLTAFAIPETTSPYHNLILRTSGAPDARVHARVIDRKDRERVFCGLHPATVAGMDAHIPVQELSTMTIAATAVALRVFSNLRFPVLSCIRLVLDTNDISSLHARSDMVRVLSACHA